MAAACKEDLGSLWGLVEELMLAGESPHAMVYGLGELLAPLSLHLVEGLEKPVDGEPGSEPALLSLGRHQGPPRLRCPLAGGLKR